jgi:tripartite-type tricarboxylate transporter receptor subunit TctC
MTKRFGWMVVALAAVTLTRVGSAAAQESFYAGKTIRLVVGTSAGGGFDTYSRTLARHLGRHLPGSPTFVVENMAGAGGLIAANHLYRVARPDGLTLGTFVGTLLLSKLYDRPGAEFDALRFEYIGQPARTSPSCTFTRQSGITSLESWMASKTPVKLGGIGQGTEFDDVARILVATLGLPIQLVSGYKGSAEVRLAAEAGEVAGGCWTYDSVRVTWAKALETGDAVVVLQISPRPHPDLPKVPLAVALARTDEARQLIDAGIHAPSTMYRPYVAPPGTPKDRVQLLRRAFQATLADPDFVAEAQKARLTIDPVSGEELEQTVGRMFRLSPPLVAKLKEILFPR